MISHDGGESPCVGVLPSIHARLFGPLLRGKCQTVSVRGIALW